MSYAADYDPSLYDSYEQPVLVDDSALRRSNLLPVPFMIPSGICAMSYLGGGLPRLTDVGMLILTLLCFVCVLIEIAKFPKRYGFGGLTLYGGVLIWLCHDYFTNWFRYDFYTLQPPFSAQVIAKAAMWHCIFIFFMSIGLLIPRGGYIEKAMCSIPEPSDNRLYLWIICGLTVIGFLPFFVWSYDPIHTTLLKSMFGSWMGQINWSVGRTGLANTNWGGYVAQFQQVGQIGGILAVFYAILIGRSSLVKVGCWLLWLFWTLSVFQEGRRGPTLAMLAPPMGLLFIKYHSIVAEYFRKHSFKAYLIAGLWGFVLLVALQFQGTFRNTAFGGASFSQLDLTKNQGNTMFSEGLKAWSMIPDRVDFFYNTFPGEGFIRPIPEQLMNFFIGIIPRALWPNKPIDKAWEWYNFVVAGTSGNTGTTISHGLVGHWYFRYGPWGVIEGALLMGWLMAIGERTLLNSNGRPMTLLFSMGFLVWLFRCYRGYAYNNLYGLVLGAIAFVILVRILRSFGQQQPSESNP